jgi:glucose/arabinose dehydrogenase
MTKDTVFSDGTNPSMPSGLAFKDGALYVGALSHILRFADIESKLNNPGVPEIVTSAFPDKRQHGWKSIAFGPDGKLYVPVGAPGNTSLEVDEFMNMSRINADGSGLEVFAYGIRNSVGFDWHPETGDLWFTDNGIDGLGDDMPADELNRISKMGQHFGFPYVHQGDTLDQRYGKGKKLEDYVAPAQKLLPHTAALGMKFYSGDMFPDEYKNVIFIAEHGSWNSSVKKGYRITTVREENGVGVEYKPFATGFLVKGGTRDRAWGRPCDVVIMKDGSMLVSDTNTGAIYRISYK